MKKKYIMIDEFKSGSYIVSQQVFGSVWEANAAAKKLWSALNDTQRKTRRVHVGVLLIDSNAKTAVDCDEGKLTYRKRPYAVTRACFDSLTAKE